MKKVSRKIFIITLISAMIFSLTACANKTEKKQESSNEKSKNELKKAYSAYIDVLKDNEDSIKGYDWQQEINGSKLNYSPNGGKGGTNRQIAICDINGDEIPELLFMKKGDNEYVSELSIYTYADGKAEEINYSIPNESGETKFQDAQVAAGTSYVIYKGKEKNSLYAFNSIGDVNWQYKIYKFNINGTEMKLSKVIKNRFVGEYGKNIDEYKIDGKEVSVSEGAKAFKDSFDELEKSLIYSGRAGEDKDCSIWLEFKSDDALAMSYEEAMEKLSK